MTSTATEIERKYWVPDDFVLPDVASGAPAAAASVTGPDRVDLDATYYDTGDLRLAAQGMTLRRREGGDDEGWHLKRPAKAGKTETREPLSAGTDVPSSLTQKIRVVTQDTALIPVARIRTLRDETTVRDADGQPLAVIADDIVSADRIVGTPATTRWREIEVELINGKPEILDAIEATLHSAGARRASTPSKLARALGEYAPAGQPDSGNGDHTDCGTMIISYVAAQRDAMIRHEPRARAADPDGIHDMRVASRRARAALRTYRRFLPADRVEALDGELHWLAGLLGAVRDSQILRVRLRRAVKDLPPELVLGHVLGRIDERLVAAEAIATAELGDALGSDRLLALMSGLGALIDEPAPQITLGQLRRRARRALRRADKRLDHAQTVRRRAASSGPGRLGAADDYDVALHDGRKACKRARYAIEVLIPAIGRPARRLAKRLGDLQDVLGGHQDAVVAARLLREFGVRAHIDGDSSFTYGLLFAEQTAAAGRTLDDLDRSVRRATKRRLRRGVVNR